MPNPYVNKVTVNNATIIDLTTDTAVAADVAAGKYFHLASGERVQGTASGGGGDSYTLTTVVPQQTVTPQEVSGSYQATLTYTAGLEDGEAYLVTFDGEEYVCTCGVYWGSDYMAGYADLFWGVRNINPYPFGIDYAPSTPEFAVATYDLNQHTIKVEHLEIVDGPLTIIRKSITANGTYNASNDNADGYSSVTVNVPSGGGNDFIVTLAKNSQTDEWEPDCTYADAYAAYQAGKTIVARAGSYAAANIDYDSGDGCFYYSVMESFDEPNGTFYYNYGIDSHYYIWDSSGAEPDATMRCYATEGANAVPSDVANGKRFFNASGIQTGTASGGSSMNVQVAQSTTRVASTAYTKTASLTCSKAGTYDVYWDCFRSSTGGTNGSQLYIGGSAYGTPNTTFASGNHVQSNHLTGVTLAANQEVAVYVRSRATNYYAYCGQLTIVQTA